MENAQVHSELNIVERSNEHDSTANNIGIGPIAPSDMPADGGRSADGSGDVDLYELSDSPQKESKPTAKKRCGAPVPRTRSSSVSVIRPVQRAASEPGERSRVKPRVSP